MQNTTMERNIFLASIVPLYKQRTFSSSSQRDVAEGKVRFEVQEKLDLLLLEVATWKAQEVMQEVLKEQRLAFA